MGRMSKRGGCQCGRIRFQATVDPDAAYLCHCRMCQRATGGVAAAFVHLAKTDCRWECEPDWYESSPIARRPHCANCGTPLGFAFKEGENMDLTVGSFDEPYDFTPNAHFGAEAIHEAWLDTSGLPRQKTSDYAPLVERWIAATGKVPD